MGRAHPAPVARARCADSGSDARPNPLRSELLALRERIRQLESQVAIMRRQLRARAVRKRYTLRERLAILWHLETFQVPRRKIREVFGIARSTLYRWLRGIEEQASPKKLPSSMASRTPHEIAEWVWDLAMANARWGRTRIAQQLRCLKVFLAASTVRRILERPRPKPRPGRPAPIAESPARPQATPVLPPPSLEPAPRPVPAFRPNHVWSADRTLVRTWGLWTIYLLVAIDHFSRKVILTVPLEGPNAAWTCQALEDAFRRLGPPRHLITDREGIFTGAAFRALLDDPLKHEWLDHVPLLRGFKHLTRLCEDFVEWYNAWRPHTRHDGFTPDQAFRRDLPEHVPKTAKSAPLDDQVERRVFADTKIVGFRLRDAA